MKNYDKSFFKRCEMSFQKKQLGKIENFSFYEKKNFMGAPLYVAKIDTDLQNSFWVFGNEENQVFYDCMTSGSPAAYNDYLGSLVKITPGLLTDYAAPPRGGKKYHAFICHSSDDKVSFVKPLVDELTNLGFHIWYDEFCIPIGKSLRQEIDRGLRSSRYGIIVFSKSFLKKGWANYELDGLVELNLSTKRSVLIPIWYGLDKKDVRKFSPPLSDLNALVTSHLEFDQIVKSISGILRE